MFTWPWRRFEEMFRRHLARLEREKLERMHDLMVAAINSNPNYDGEQASDARAERLRQLGEMRADGIRLISAAARGEKEVETRQAEEAWENDELFGVYRRGASNVVSPTMTEAGAGAALVGG
jgi:hypothetical protein